MKPVSIARNTFCGVVVAMGSIATSQAGTILQTLGWANGYETVNVVGTAQPVSDNGPAGGLAGIWKRLGILVFCDDLGHYFSPGSTFTHDYQASRLSLAPG